MMAPTSWLNVGAATCCANRPGADAKTPQIAARPAPASRLAVLAWRLARTSRIAEAPSFLTTALFVHTGRGTLRRDTAKTFEERCRTRVHVDHVREDEALRNL